MTVTVRTLAGPGLGAMNGFDTPDAVVRVPKNATVSLTGGGKVLSYTLPPFSFVVLPCSRRTNQRKSASRVDTRKDVFTPCSKMTFICWRIRRPW